MQDLSSARPIFISEIEQFGGAERALLALSRWLSEHGLANYLLTYRDGCNIASYATHALEVVDLQVQGGVRAKVAALKVHMGSRAAIAPKLLASGYQPALHATLAGLRGFHDLMHDTPALFGDEAVRDWKGRLRIAVSNRIAGFGLRSGGATIVTSEFLREECRKDFGVEAQIARMGGLAAAARGESAGGQRDAAKMDSQLAMLSISRIEANKRIDWLLRACAALESGAVAPLRAPLSAVVDWRLDLAGKGSLIPQLTAMAENLGIGPRVHFHGFVPDAELERMFGSARLFLMPAVQGYGIPAVEAIERGVPVLLHRESGVSDILRETPWATVLEGGEEAMAGALALAIDGVLKGLHTSTPPPQLPTESEWAERVAKLCNWV